MKPSLNQPVRANSVEGSEFTERKVVHEEGKQWGGEATSEDSGEIVAVDLDASVAVVGRDNPVLGEHEVERPAGLPPSQVDLDGGVWLCVPLVDLIKSVENVTVDVLRYILGKLELFLLVEKSKILRGLTWGWLKDYSKYTSPPLGLMTNPHYNTQYTKTREENLRDLYQCDRIIIMFSFFVSNPNKYTK